MNVTDPFLSFLSQRMRQNAAQDLANAPPSAAATSGTANYFGALADMTPTERVQLMQIERRVRAKSGLDMLA